MGKQTRKAFRSRTDPLGARASSAVQQGMASQQPTTLNPDQVLPVIGKLSSPDATERGWAAASISNLVLSSNANLKLVLSNGGVGGLIKLLSDEKREVIEEALGTLRNMCTVEPDVCQEYFQKDIIGSLAKLLPDIICVIDNTLKNTPVSDHADQDKRTSIWDVTENFIYIVWTLSEFSDESVKTLDQLNIVSFLISFLTPSNQCPSRVVIAAGQCLATLTDNNKGICNQFQHHPEYTQTLYSVVQNANDSSKLLICVLSCAILMNIHETLGSEDGKEGLNKSVLPILISSLDFDIQNAARETITAIQSGNLNKSDQTIDIFSKPNQPVTKEETYVQNVAERLATLQLSLELLANICSQDDTEDGWEDGGEDMDEDGFAEDLTDNLNEDNVDEHLQEAQKLSQGSLAVDEEVVRSSPIVKSFIREVFPHLIRLATPTDLSFSDELAVPTVVHGLALTHQRAMECLNNFLLAMNEVPSKFWFKESSPDATQTWRWLFNTANIIASKPESENRNESIEAVVGCLWCLGRGLGQNIPLESSDVPSLLGAYRNTQSVSMQVKTVGCLSTIASRQGDVNTNKEIGVFVMELLKGIENRSTPNEVSAEALNFIFDVYNDCAFDYDLPVYVQGDFNNQLKKLVPSVKVMVKSIDKRKEHDLRHRCDEALMNLVAFIKYKATERR
ncbi:armadillo-type protein [Sporodiniella umbellata]|nr:armadillo-type protein [Sporodiniella umbellata]